MKIGQRLKLAAHAIFKRSGEWERIWGNATSVRTAAGTNINESSFGKDSSRNEYQ